MNATNASFHFENSAPRFTSATFRIYLDKLEWKSHLDHLHILWFIAGPAMWTTNLIGIALNAVIVLLGLFFSKSVISTNITLIVRICQKWAIFSQDLDIFKKIDLYRKN